MVRRVNTSSCFMLFLWSTWQEVSGIIFSDQLCCSSSVFNSPPILASSFDSAGDQRCLCCYILQTSARYATSCLTLTAQSGWLPLVFELHALVLSWSETDHVQSRAGMNFCKWEQRSIPIRWLPDASTALCQIFSTYSLTRPGCWVALDLSPCV